LTTNYPILYNRYNTRRKEMSCPDPLYDYADWLEEDEREYDEPESDEQ
jgi:hypothetical protein